MHRWKFRHDFAHLVSRCLWFLALPLSLLAVSPSQAGEPEVRQKTNAPDDLQAVFQLQEATESRRTEQGLKLPRRTLLPMSGIESGLLAQHAGKDTPVFIVMVMDRFPTAEAWGAWATRGLTYVEYLGHRHWLVKLNGDVQAAFAMTQAVAFRELRPSDKVSPVLDDYLVHPEFFDAERHLIVLHIVLSPDADPIVVDELRRSMHRPDVEYLQVDEGPRHLSLVTHPSSIERLQEMSEVVSIAPGAWVVQPLMDGVRATAHGDDVIGVDGEILTGQGVRAATNEDLGKSWVAKIHDAFWEHDALGQKTTPRWTPLAESLNCGRFFPNSPGHGVMTAGVMLGNGWHSGAYIGDPLGFRGIAPQATLECFFEPGAHAHASSHSYLPGPSNGGPVGTVSEERHHATIVALGNSGLSNPHGCGAGYYSVCNGQKNLLGVANAQVNGEIYAGSSAGPTWDGRIKPDISAPTGNTNATLVAGGWSMEISRIQILRNGQSLFSWNFLMVTPEGWGQTVSGIGRGGVDVVPLHGRIELHIEQEIDDDWGGWGGTPVVGTEVDAQGNPLDFVGQAGDVLKVDYRATGLGYFDLIPIWFRDHPYVAPNCTEDVYDDGDCPWYSQSFHGGIGIGDGQWRTLEIPIGQAGDWNQDPLSGPWDDEQTWAGEPIQFLGLRFRGTQIQPTTQYSQYYNQNTGGTSGASPVLGGAYALAMENLTRINGNVDLDERLRRSIYYASSWTAPPFGMPLNSTWKALFVHTADDMIRLSPTPSTPPNPDTGIANIYHAGPDYTTGYGMVDIQSAIGLMNREAAQDPMFDVIEFELRPGYAHTYTQSIPDAYTVGDGGFKVTLVWDDSPAGSSLTNNLSLAVEAPDGTIYHPWSLDVPPLPVTAAGIVPARRDQPNDRDNIEQVLIDDVPKFSGGTWLIHVSDGGMADPMFVQKYSLVISPWDIEGQCHTCD